MAVRLSVVMIHTSPATPNAERIAQGVVGELIGMNGIDLILVGPLDSLGEASTDRLTLSSISGDIAILDWQHLEAIDSALGRLEIGGRRAVHPADRGASDPDRSAVETGQGTDLQYRKLYLFNLNDFSRPEDVVSALAELNSVRSLRTFALDLAANPRRPDLTESAQSPHEVAGPPNEGSSGQSGGLSDANLGKTDSSEESGEVKPAKADFDLDALIDQLDQLDP